MRLDYKVTSAGSTPSFLRHNLQSSRQTTSPTEPGEVFEKPNNVDPPENYQEMSMGQETGTLPLVCCVEVLPGTHPQSFHSPTSP